MTEREKIAARIRALRAKTVENGCTEDEAMAAAAKVAELLEQYNIGLDEAEMRASPFSRETSECEYHLGHRCLWKVAATISKLTGARWSMSGPGSLPVEFSFFGFSHEVEVAQYLLEICANAMRSEMRRILNGEEMVRRRQRSQVLPFLDGMADRLSRRITDMIPPRPTGKGLIVLHDALIDEWCEQENIKTKSGRGGGSRSADAAYREGLQAGDRVGLNQGVTGPSPVAGRLASQ